MAQSVKRPASAQVMISWFVRSSPGLGSVLTAQSLEPASDSVSPSFSAPPPLMLCLCLCLSLSELKINIKKKSLKTEESRGARNTSKQGWGATAVDMARAVLE